MKTQQRIRIYQLGEFVAFDCEGTPGTLYLDSDMAKVLGKELLRFAKETSKPNVSRRWWCTRIIHMVNGWKAKATNEADDKCRPYYIP